MERSIDWAIKLKSQLSFALYFVIHECDRDDSISILPCHLIGVNGHAAETSIAARLLRAFAKYAFDLGNAHPCLNAFVVALANGTATARKEKTKRAGDQNAMHE